MCGSGTDSGADVLLEVSATITYCVDGLYSCCTPFNLVKHFFFFLNLVGRGVDTRTCSENPVHGNSPFNPVHMCILNKSHSAFLKSIPLTNAQISIKSATDLAIGFRIFSDEQASYSINAHMCSNKHMGHKLGAMVEVCHTKCGPHPTK